MERMRLWIHNPAQSRIHEFQEMTLNFALICKSIRAFMINSTRNIPGTKMFQKRIQVIVMLQMKASKAWLPEMSLRIYPRVKIHWISTSLDFSELYCKEGRLESYPREKKVQDIPQPWTWLRGFCLNFEFLSIVPVTLSRDELQAFDQNPGDLIKIPGILIKIRILKFRVTWDPPATCRWTRPEMDRASCGCTQVHGPSWTLAVLWRWHHPSLCREQQLMQRYSVTNFLFIY
jgi:hypothetical protein